MHYLQKIHVKHKDTGQHRHKYHKVTEHKFIKQGIWENHNKQSGKELVIHQTLVFSEKKESSFHITFHLLLSRFSRVQLFETP